MTVTSEEPRETMLPVSAPPSMSMQPALHVMHDSLRARKKEIMQRRMFAGKTVLQKQRQSAYRKPQCVRAWGLMSPDDGGNAWCQLLTHTCTSAGIPTIPRVPQWNSTEPEEERSITEGGRKQTTNTDTRTVKDSSTEGRAAGGWFENNSSQSPSAVCPPSDRSGSLWDTLHFQRLQLL